MKRKATLLKLLAIGFWIAISLFVSQQMFGQLIGRPGPLVAVASGGGSGYTADNTEYQDLYDTWTNKPSSSVAQIQDSLITLLKDSTVWDEGDAMWVLANHSNDGNEAQYNWYDETADSATNNGATYTASQGFAGNGSSTYVDLNWNPTDDGNNYEQDSATIAIYRRTNSLGSAIGGNDGTAVGYILPRHSNAYMYALLNNDNAQSATSSNSGYGTFIVTRNDINVFTGYINNTGTTIYDNTTGLPGVDFYVCGHNASGALSEPSTGEISIVWIGGYLSALQVRALHFIMEWYMDRLGKGVL